VCSRSGREQKGVHGPVIGVGVQPPEPLELALSSPPCSHCQVCSMRAAMHPYLSAAASLSTKRYDMNGYPGQTTRLQQQQQRPT
jgi:hypothetical protein